MMKTVFVDANVFLRFFTEDKEEQTDRAEALFRKGAGGKLDLVTGPPVLFEVAWTLRRAYGQPREKVLDVLARIAMVPGLRLTDRKLVEEAIRLAQQAGQEFPDAYISASASAVGAHAVATFNRKDFEALGVTFYSL